VHNGTLLIGAKPPDFGPSKDSIVNQAAKGNAEG